MLESKTQHAHVRNEDRPQRQKNNKLLFKEMGEHEKWSKCEAQTHTWGPGRLQGLVVGCRGTDLKQPPQFQASSSSQERVVALLVLRSASCCRERVAGSVRSSYSQSVSKAPKFKEKEQVCVYGSTVRLVCCIEAARGQRTSAKDGWCVQVSRLWRSDRQKTEVFRPKRNFKGSVP